MTNRFTLIDKVFWLLLALLPGLVPGQSQTLTKQIQEFDQYVQSARMDWAAPGLAIVVVKNGQVIFKKGYGVRQLGYKDPVDPQTLFACASTTKAMTAACMGMLVDEGKVNWNDPVIKYLPDFQLYDPFVTRELKVRDLFLHDSGVGNADFLWTFTPTTSDGIIEKMRLVEPSYSLRSGFIYQNLFYLVAGKVIEKVSGQPWEDFIRKRLFGPLQMTRTQPMKKFVDDRNQAAPHALVDEHIMVIENSNADPIAPAGAVWSCVEDMGKWVACMLDSSKYPGGKLLKPGTWAELLKPQVIVPSNEYYATQKLTHPNWTTYGLGWFQQDYKGRKINMHTGSLSGTVALHAQMPEENLGMYVYINMQGCELRHALMYKVFDLFALGGNRDWSTEIKKLYGELDQKNKQRQKNFETSRVLNTSPTHSLQDYAGRYTDPLYGEAIVTVQDKSLMVQINNYATAALDHWHYDTFYGRYQKTWWGTATASFSLDATGKINKLNFDGMNFSRAK